MSTKQFLPGPLREWVRHKLRGAGFDRVPFPRMQMLARHGVTVLFDVGASEGLYAEELRQLGYAGRFVPVEPRADVCARLSARRDPRWTAVALGREATTTAIHLSGAGDSNSLLAMLPRHTDAPSGTAYVDEQAVEVHTLDAVVDGHVGPGDVAFLRMDVQGYKQHVLEGVEYVSGAE